MPLTKLKKLETRLRAKPKDFTFEEMKKLLQGYGYREIKTGKTAGSRAAFVHDATRHVIRLHRPHPGKIVKRYQLDLIEAELRTRGIIE